MQKKIEKIEEIIRETYLVIDPGIVRVVCAAVIAHRLPADPVWLFIVAGSGSGKTEFLNAVGTATDVVPLSSLTPNTFISGQQRVGKETSLLLKINNGILSFKDFTSVLSMRDEDRNAIMGQLREIYDGSYKKAFGTGEEINWKGKISMLAGVTTKIHITQYMYAAMGERFIMYHFDQPDRIEVARRAMHNADTIIEKREFIQKLFKTFLDEELPIPDSLPDIGDELKEEIILLADLTTRARSSLERNYRSPQQEITFRHDLEMPTRFSIQLCVLAAALKIVNDNEIGPIERNIIYKIGLDSIPHNRRMCLQQLLQHSSVETSEIATLLGFSTDTVRRWLEDLDALDIVNRIKTTHADRWELHHRYRDILKKFEKICIDNRTKEEKELDDNIKDIFLG